MEYDKLTDLTVQSFGVPVEAVIPDPSLEPKLLITSVAGLAVPASPADDFSNPDVVFTQAGTLTVTVAATNIPEGTPVTLHIIYDSQLVILPGSGDPVVNVTSGVATFTGTVPTSLGTMQAFADVTFQ